MVEHHRFHPHFRSPVADLFQVKVLVPHVCHQRGRTFWRPVIPLGHTAHKLGNLVEVLNLRHQHIRSLRQADNRFTRAVSPVKTTTPYGFSIRYEYCLRDSAGISAS